MREKLSGEMNGDERDTYAWIEAHYPLSSSHEELLSSAPHLLPNSNLISSEAEEDPVLVMLSVPMTSSEYDEYTTPPERHSTEARFEGQEDEENIVDLSRDSYVFGGTECKLNVLASVCADEFNGLKCNGKGTAATAIATDADFVCGSGNASRSSKFRVFPFSIDSRIATDQRDGVGICQGGRRAGTCRVSNSAGSGAGKGVDKQGNSDADDSSGKKSSERNKEEPSEKEQTENILKVLSVLAKQRRPVYKEKVDIVGSAIKAGITFPRPSWRPEDSDDDSD